MEPVTRLYFYDVMGDNGACIEIEAGATPEAVRAWLARHPTYPSTDAAIVAFVRNFTAAEKVFGRELAEIRLDGIPCANATQWFDEFAHDAPNAIAWDPVAGHELPRPAP